MCKACFPLFFILSIAIWGSNLYANPPELGSSELTDYTSESEKKLGMAFLQTLYDHYPLITDPMTVSYIRNLGHKLASHSNRQEFRFYIIDNDEINAFAGPNGIIGIHSGLILASESEDELASVIAHEIAHVTQNHLARRYEQQTQVNLTQFASLLAAILISAHSSEAAQAVYLGGINSTIEQQLKHSRTHEKEADHLGIELLHKAGYNPNAMTSFFDKLYQQSRQNEFNTPEILRTHPVTEERLAQSKNRAQRLAQKSTSSGKEFDFIKKHLQQLSQKTLNQDLQHTEQPNCTTVSQHNNSTLCIKTNNESTQLNRFKELEQAKSMLMKNPEKGLSALKTLHDIFPNDHAVLFYLADAFILTNKTHLARKLIEQHSLPHIYKYDLYLLIAQAFSNQEELAKAYYYQALANHAIGKNSYAKHLAEQATENLQDNEKHLKSKIKTLSEKIVQDTEKKEKHP